MNIVHLFTDHPASIGETYAQHLRSALLFGIRLVFGGLACMVHALLPFVFVRTASDCVAELHERMVASRRSPPRAASQCEQG